MFLVAIVSLVAFVIRELTATAPAVNLRLFKDPVFASGTIIGGLMFAMLMANMFLLPLFMQELLGFTATQSGLSLMPRVGVMMIATPIVGRIYDKLSPHLMIGLGAVFVSFGSLLLSRLTLESGAHDVIAAIAVQGVGFSCLFVPLTTIALAKVPRHLMADATGLNSLIRQVGGAIGLAIFATMLASHATVASDGLRAHLSTTSHTVIAHLTTMQRALQARGLDPVSAKTAALEALAGTVAAQSTVLSFERVFVIAGALFLLVIPMLVFLRKGSTGAVTDTHVEV